MLDDRDRGTWPLVAFVLGGLTGLSISVLVAPSSGAETRGRIGSGARRLARRPRG